MRRLEEDRWLAACYLTLAARRRVIALTAIHCELRRIPGAVTEPPLGEIRFQWWREALDELLAGEPPRAHPVIAFAAETKVVTASSRKTIEGAIDAGAETLYAPPGADIDAYIAWCARAEGYLAALRSCDGGLSAEEFLIDAEAAFAVARHGAADVGAARWPALRDRAREIIREAARRLSALRADEASRHLHLALIGARLKSPGPFTPIMTRLILFKTMATGRF